jgi:hypothetical protein
LRLTAITLVPTDETAQGCRRNLSPFLWEGAAVADSVTQILLVPLMIYAACGLVLSLAVHLLSLAGLQPPGGNALFVALHVGIFPMWLPVILIMMKLTTGMRPSFGWHRDYWKVLFSGCPAWMRYMTNGFFIYAIVNFVVFMMIGPTGKHIGGDPPTSVWRGFSGHWMVFYSAGLAIFTTAYQRGISNLLPKCRNGHTVGLGDEFCSTCGVPITRSEG